jgi:hypothetical protein
MLARVLAFLVSFLWPRSGRAFFEEERRKVRLWKKFYGVFLYR